MMPLFPQDICACGGSIDPLGLHFASCLKLNARNLLHNALRDCFCGAARHLVQDLADHNVAFIKSDSIAKSTTYIHSWYPRKANAPQLLERSRQPGVRPKLAPSKSPDVLIAFLDEPHRPIFGDFVFSSPRDNVHHSHAAQVAYNLKMTDYFAQHDILPNVFFPLAAERSGYLHPVFVDFIDVIVCRSTNSPPKPSHKLQLLYSISHSITYMTAGFLHAASFQFTPAAVKSLMPPPPLMAPVRWAPKLVLHKDRHHALGFSSTSNSTRRSRAETSPLPRRGCPAPHASEGRGRDPSETAGCPPHLLNGGDNRLSHGGPAV